MFPTFAFIILKSKTAGCKQFVANTIIYCMTLRFLFLWLNVFKYYWMLKDSDYSIYFPYFLLNSIINASLGIVFKLRFC